MFKENSISSIMSQFDTLCVMYPQYIIIIDQESLSTQAHWLLKWMWHFEVSSLAMLTVQRRSCTFCRVLKNIKQCSQLLSLAEIVSLAADDRAGSSIPQNEPAFSRCALLQGMSECLRFPSPAIQVQQDNVLIKQASFKSMAMVNLSKSNTHLCIIYVYWIHAVWSR